MRATGTARSLASCFWLSFSGSMNSKRRISPGGIGSRACSFSMVRPLEVCVSGSPEGVETFHPSTIPVAGHGDGGTSLRSADAFVEHRPSEDFEPTRRAKDRSVGTDIALRRRPAVPMACDGYRGRVGRLYRLRPSAYPGDSLRIRNRFHRTGLLRI